MAKLDQIEIDGTLYEVVPEIGPLFSASTAYNAGDCVIKDAVLYRFKTAHAAGAWVGTDADAIEVGKELTQTNERLGDILEPYGYNLFNPMTITNGVGLGSTTGEEQLNSNYWTSDWISIDNSKNVGFKAFEYTGSVSGRVYFYDANKTFISRKTGNPNISAPPTGAVYCRISEESDSNIYGTVDPWGVVVTQSVASTDEMTSYVPYAYAIDKLLRDTAFLKSVIPTQAITDMNNLPSGQVYYLSNNAVASNFPSFFNVGYFVTFPLGPNNILQIGYKYDGTNACARAKTNGTWGTWALTGQEYVEKLRSIAFKYLASTGVTNADEITDIGYYYLSANSVTNLPETSGAWYLWSVKLGNNNLMQLAFNAVGTKPYLRAKVNGTWSTWQKIGKESAEEAINNLIVTSSIALFPTVGCCGDSFTAGYLYNKTDSPYYDPTYVPNGEYPAIGYPAVMGRLYGIDVTAFAKGGLTTTAYRTDAKGLPALVADTAKDLYIICLGLNDKTQEIPIGVEADIDTEPASATYLGNMGAIIRAITTHAPLSKIVLMKSPWVYSEGGSSANGYYNYSSDAIELLSTHFGIPYLETLNDPYFCSNAYVNGLKGLHPTAPLYAGMGKRIGELVGKCVIDNPQYFYNFYVPNT